MKLPCPASKTWLTLLRRSIPLALIIAVMTWVASPGLIEAQSKRVTHPPGSGKTFPCEIILKPTVSVEWDVPDFPPDLPYGTVVKGTLNFIDGLFIPATKDPARPTQAWPWRNKRPFPVSVKVVRDGTKVEVRYTGDFKRDPCSEGGEFEAVTGAVVRIFDVLERPPNLSAPGNGQPLPSSEYTYEPGIPDPPPAILPGPPVTLPPNSTPTGSPELHGEVSLAATQIGGKLLNHISHKDRGTIPTLCAATIPIATPSPGGAVLPDQTIELTTSVVSVFCGEPQIYAALSIQPSNTAIANQDYEFFAWPEGRPEPISSWPYQGPRDSRSNLVASSPVRRCLPDLPFKITFRPKPQPTPPRMLHLDFSYLPYQPETSLTVASNQVRCTPILKTKISLVPDATTPEEYHGEVNLDLDRDQYELTQFIRHKERGDIPTLCNAPIVIIPTPPAHAQPLEQEIPLSLTFLSVNANQSSVPAILQIEPKEIAIAQEDYEFFIEQNGQRQPITEWPYQAPPDLWDIADAVPGVYRVEPSRSIKLVFRPIDHPDHRAPRMLSFVCSYEPRPTQPSTATAQAIRQTEITLLPIEVVEVSPKVKDDDGNDILGSEYPSIEKPLTPFVELNPVTDRIAHRELKVHFGDALKNRNITWTLGPVPGETPATIRGLWTPSTTHPDRFEASAAFVGNGFTRLSQASARTSVSDDGFTGIRVNVPPVAYNKIRIHIAIEGVATIVKLIDMEVPAIVVIDPGHGGTGPPPLGGSDANHAVSASLILEKTMTLDFGLLLRNRLESIRTRDGLNMKIFMTRSSDVNPSLPVRANKARDTGADILLSLHFNGFNKIVRGTETFYDSIGNVNLAADQGLAGRVNPAVFGAILAKDAGALNRGVKGQDLGVLNDSYLGNSGTYRPIRAVLLETEFIDVPAVDQLLNTNKNHQQVRWSIINALADALQDDLINNPQ